MKRSATAAVILIGAFASAHATPTVIPEGVTIHEKSETTPGYVLHPHAGTVRLITPRGKVVHTWTAPYGNVNNVRPLDDGHVLTLSGNRAVELNWDGAVVWEYAAPPGVTFHHDYERLANGNTIILARQDVTVPSISDKSIRDDFILEVSQTGAVVWEWHTVDHIDEFEFSAERRELIFEKGGDWSHANSISAITQDNPHTDPRLAPGNIIISYRTQNTVAIIDRVTGDVTWSLTNRTIGQHNAHMLPSGNILVFDNGWNGHYDIPGRFYSRVVEIDPLTTGVVYEYDATDSGSRNWTFYSGIISGAQRLWTGNTLIVEGTTGRIFEVTPAGQIVWEYINPKGLGSRSVYRAYKVPFSWAPKVNRVHVRLPRFVLRERLL